MTDLYDLQRFVDAQSPVFETVLRELSAGRKRTHWMWFVFPQLKGLGHSAMAAHYGIASRDEAKAYLAHELLGPRLVDCTRAMLAVQGRSANAILGSPDDLKFRSSMTLFARVATTTDVFREALQAYADGREDPATVALLEEAP